jgi:hypothetical protein
MPEWLVFMLVVWFAMRVLSGARCRHGRHESRGRIRGESAGPPLPPRKHEETIEEELRRRYVLGEMNVEEYERALDRLYRKA